MTIDLPAMLAAARAATAWEFPIWDEDELGPATHAHICAWNPTAAQEVAERLIAAEARVAKAMATLQRCIEDAATDENLDGCEYLKDARDELIAGGYPLPDDAENTRLLALNQQLVAECERLREALAPFAERYKLPGTVQLDFVAVAEDCRRAREALERKNG